MSFFPTDFSVFHRFSIVAALLKFFTSFGHLDLKNRPENWDEQKTSKIGGSKFISAIYPEQILPQATQEFYSHVVIEARPLLRSPKSGGILCLHMSRTVNFAVNIMH